MISAIKKSERKNEKQNKKHYLRPRLNIHFILQKLNEKVIE